MRHTLLNIGLIAALVPLSSFSEVPASADSVQVVRENMQHAFPLTVPAGNYSGIAYLGNHEYAVVDDKSADGFTKFHIELDSVTGDIISVQNMGFVPNGEPNRDQEGIAYVPFTNTVWVSGERGNEIKEMTLDGKLTQRKLQIPEVFNNATGNYGFEGFTYNATTHRFWTTTESTLKGDGQQATSTQPCKNRLRLQSFTDNLRPDAQYWYEMDMPEAAGVVSNYAMGVSELCALDNGSVLVLEREFYVPKTKIGAWVNCKLYVVNPSEVKTGELLQKRLITTVHTKFTLFNRSIANYEGMCIGPKLKDGSQVLIMVSDSQNQYAGMLKDWWKSFLIRL